MKLVAFVLPGYPTLSDSLEVLDFLSRHRQARIETALPQKNAASYGIVRRVHRKALDNGILAHDVLHVFQRIHPSFLMLPKKPDPNTLKKISQTFDVALFPAAPATIKKLNASKGTRFAAKVRPGQKNLAAWVRAAEGLVYLQCAPGRGKPMYSTKKIKETLTRIRATKKIPVYAGYGIKTRADIQTLAELGVDAVVLGTQSVRHQQKGPKAFKKWFLDLQKPRKN